MSTRTRSGQGWRQTVSSFGRPGWSSAAAVHSCGSVDTTTCAFGSYLAGTKLVGFTRSDAVSAGCLAECQWVLLDWRSVTNWGFAMSTVIHKTPEQLRDQRARLLAEVGMSYEQLRDRAEVYSLSMDELDVWHTIEGIDYLLDGDRGDVEARRVSSRVRG